MTGNDALPVTGDFDSAALASGRRIDPAQWGSDGPLLGLVREAGYVWGTVRDDDGNLFSVMRRLDGVPADSLARTEKDDRALGDRLIVTSTVDAAGDALGALCVRPEPRISARGEDVHRTSRPGGVTFSATDSARAGMRLDLTADHLGYQEEGVVDLAGVRSCPALQWYLPGPESALLYLTQTWEVTGRVLGRRVRGFLFWEEAYMYPGARLYVSKDPLHDAAYTSWYSWATRYDDGTTEVGHFLIGERSFGVGVVASSSGEVSVADRVTGTITLAPDGQWHDGIDYDLDGVAWRCEPDPRGRMQLGQIPNPQQEGRVFRTGDTRTPALHMAWGESVPGRVALGDRA